MDGHPDITALPGRKRLWAATFAVKTRVMRRRAGPAGGARCVQVVRLPPPAAVRLVERDSGMDAGREWLSARGGR